MQYYFLLLQIVSPVPVILESQSMVVNSTAVIVVWSPAADSTSYRIYVQRNGEIEQTFNVSIQSNWFGKGFNSLHVAFSIR